MTVQQARTAGGSSVGFANGEWNGAAFGGGKEWERRARTPQVAARQLSCRRQKICGPGDSRSFHSLSPPCQLFRQSARLDCVQFTGTLSEAGRGSLRNLRSARLVSLSNPACFPFDKLLHPLWLSQRPHLLSVEADDVS